MQAITNDNLRMQDHRTLTDKRVLRARPNSSPAYLELGQRVNQRLETVKEKMQAVSPDAHSALLFSLLGAFRGAAGFNPSDLEAAVDVFEMVLEDFNQTPKG